MFLSNFSNTAMSLNSLSREDLFGFWNTFPNPHKSLLKWVLYKIYSMSFQFHSDIDSKKSARLCSFKRLTMSFSMLTLNLMLFFFKVKGLMMVMTMTMSMMTMRMTMRMMTMRMMTMRMMTMTITMLHAWLVRWLPPRRGWPHWPEP